MSKELFSIIDKKCENLDLSNIPKYERELNKYEFILNICFVHMGIRSACIAGIIDHNKESFDIAKSIENYDNNLKMHNLKSGPNKEYHNIFFFNMAVIEKYNLMKDYQIIKNSKYMRDVSHKSIGKVLGYLCPSNTISTDFSNYAVITEELKKRYIYGYNIYIKKDNKIIYPYTSLFGYVCYDKKRAKKYYNKAIDYLKLLQKSVGKLTDNIHIGMEYKEEII